MVSTGPIEVDINKPNLGGMMMKKMLLVLFGVLVVQSHTFAETWQDRAANKTP